MTTHKPTAVEALRAAEKALRPFYDAVFNDNGDITVSGPHPYEDAVQGYFAYKKIAAALAAQPEEPAQPVVSIKPMRLSGNRTDYYVSIRVGKREVTPHCFRDGEWKAAYHVALYQWLLNGGEEPELLAFNPDDFPAQAYTTCSHAAPDGWVTVPRDALDWLFGEGPDRDGNHFGDGADEYERRHGAFWWRKKFRAMLSAAPGWEERQTVMLNGRPVELSGIALEVYRTMEAARAKDAQSSFRDGREGAFRLWRDPIERAYGLLWHIAGGRQANDARKILLGLIDKEGQKRGIEYATGRYGRSDVARELDKLADAMSGNSTSAPLRSCEGTQP